LEGLIHVVFIASAVFLALLDRISGHGYQPHKPEDKKANDPQASL
jgi:hypothetical protein